MLYTTAAVLVYVAGVTCGLVMTDGRPAERLVVALLWPIGPLAFVVTVLLLVAAAFVGYPAVMLPAALVAMAAVWVAC